MCSCVIYLRRASILEAGPEGNDVGTILLYVLSYCNSLNWLVVVLCHLGGHIGLHNLCRDLAQIGVWRCRTYSSEFFWFASHWMSCLGDHVRNISSQFS